MSKKTNKKINQEEQEAEEEFEFGEDVKFTVKAVCIKNDDKPKTAVEAENMFLENITTQLYTMINSHILAKLLRMYEDENFYVDPVKSTMQERAESVDNLVGYMSKKNNAYRKNLIMFKKIAVGQVKLTEEGMKDYEKMQELADNKEEFDLVNAEFDIYQKLVETLSKIYKSAITVNNIMASDPDLDGSHVKNIQLINNKICNYIKQFSADLSKTNYSHELASLADMTVMLTEENAEYINRHLQKIIDSRNSQYVAPVNLTPVHKAVSPAEQERLDYIAKANDLYNRLYQDYLVDLKKQYSNSSADMYHKIINKVETFESKFNLPLSNNASIGLAKDVINQLNKFTDSISNDIANLAEQSYISGGFFN